MKRSERTRLDLERSGLRGQNRELEAPAADGRWPVAEGRPGSTGEGSPGLSARKEKYQAAKAKNQEAH
jgi:hypothetical protein